MKRPETAKIRNIALVAHGTAGKTTLTEALLFCAGATTRLGRVEDGTTTTDFDEDEIRRKISISTSLVWAEWKGHKLNLVDTPGFAAFLTDARNTLRVVDGAVVVVGATDGVKVQTEKVWSTAASLELPRAVYLSKMDRERADFARAVEDVRKHLDDDLFKLYQLIWQRFVASQMLPAVFDQTAIDIAVGDYTFRANGSVQKFDGYLRAGRATQY